MQPFCLVEQVESAVQVSLGFHYSSLGKAPAILPIR
jgi:hypothetical protein